MRLYPLAVIELIISELRTLQGTHREILSESGWSKLNFNCIYTFPIDLAQKKFRLVLNILEKCSYNSNLVKINQILKTIICVHGKKYHICNKQFFWPSIKKKFLARFISIFLWSFRYIYSTQYDIAAVIWEVSVGLELKPHDADRRQSLGQL